MHSETMKKKILYSNLP